MPEKSISFEIVEYEPSYAAAVANLWNRSGDSWGGYNIDVTEEQTLHEEEASVCVNLYLAVVGDEVVGYCKIGKWTQDEGALYVDSLNVRPDCHGKKIGKALMLKAVERTIELGWDRLDLHTWPGNTKAVPLYKKTGFFWEERDSEVYLVNYIPVVLSNELVSDFFESADWYGDSEREIKIEPDGSKENEFTYFGYSWQKNSEYLKMEFARRGRGLRSIERNDFSIKATVEDLNLVYGRRYKIRYVVENKTSAPVELRIQGRNDRNIDFDFTYEGTVDELKEVEAEFFVGPITEVQSEWKTHPSVKAEISINGKTAEFAVGIVPKYPADIRLTRRPGMIHSGVPVPLYLDIESNLKTSAEISLVLPDLDGLRLSESTMSSNLSAEGRVSLEVLCTVEHSRVLAGVIAATVAPESGEAISFEKEVGCPLLLLNGTTHGEMPEGDNEKSYLIANGPVSVALKTKRNSFINEATVTHELAEESRFRFSSPSLGKPFSDEFIRMPPASIEVEHSDGYIGMTAGYASEDFPGTELAMIFRLSQSGIVERWFEITLTGDSEKRRPVCLLESFRLNMRSAVVPCEGSFLETRSETPNGPGNWDAEKLTENWIFNQSTKGTSAMVWDSGVKLKSDGWSFSIAHDAKSLAAGKSLKTPPVVAAMNTFGTWRQCREYALGGRSGNTRLMESLEIRLNKGNPFVGPSFSVEAIEHKQRNIAGTISFAALSGSFGKVERSCTQDQKIKTVSADIAPSSDSPDVVTAEIGMEVLQYSRGRIYFPVGDRSVVTKRDSAEGFEIFAADNGLVSIRSAPAFSPGLFECQHGENQWLDNTFPILEPRDWWGPWIGGMCTHPSGIDTGPLLKEESSAEFVERTDSMGNRWKGIAVHLRFVDHIRFKGLLCTQYFLLLPGVPVLFHQTEIIQGSGRYLAERRFETNVFVRAGDGAVDTSIGIRTRQGQRAEIRSGREERRITPQDSVTVSGAERDGRLIVYSEPKSTDLGAETNKQSTLVWANNRITCPAGERRFARPFFLIFSDRDYEEDWLADLANISLEA